MSELDALTTRAAKAASTGRVDEALDAYHRALALAPANAQIKHNIGVLLARRGDVAGAESHLLEAERLQPSSAVSPLALGHILFGVGRTADAAAAFERALRRAPDSPEAACNAGITLQALGDSARALPIIERARPMLPKTEGLFRAHFEALQALGRFEDADREFLHFEAGATPSAWLATAGLRWARTSAHADFEAKYLPQVLSWQYQLPDLHWLADIIGWIPYFDAGRIEVAPLYRCYNAMMQQSAGTAPLAARHSRIPDGRMRVGYLSSDFRRHVMGDLMLDVFRCHDRGRFSIFAYSLLSEELEDASTSRFRECCDQFTRLAEVSDSAGAERIAADDLDVLVDLTSHTPQARPAILLRKPARVIVAHLGDHGSIGLEQVDFKLTDGIADLPDAGEYQIERPLAMQGCVMPFRRVTPSVPDPAGRSRLHVPDRAVIFGVFAAVRKLSPRSMELWRRILDAVPGSYIALSPFTDAARRQSIARFISAGILANRIVVIQPSADDAANRARYRNIDVLLDTLPYTGGDSTVAALDMGVPVVTLSGERQAERMGLSILSHLGVTETVAKNDEEYVSVACRLATNAAWRAEISTKILDGIAASGIADVQRYTRSMEGAFECALAQKLADAPEQSVDGDASS